MPLVVALRSLGRHSNSYPYRSYFLPPYQIYSSGIALFHPEFFQSGNENPDANSAEAEELKRDRYELLQRLEG